MSVFPQIFPATSDEIVNNSTVSGAFVTNALNNLRTAAGQLCFQIYEGGGVLTTLPKIMHVRLPYAITITGWEIVCNESGSIVIDVWKGTYANFPSTVADTITASAKPTVTTAQKATSTTLTGWTTSLPAGAYVNVNVDSVTSITYALLNLTYTRT